MSNALIAELKAAADPVKAAFFPRFFKAGPGEYAEGDVFMGVTVPQVRSIIKKHREMPLQDMEKLLHSPLHECRLAALIIMVDQFKKSPEAKQKSIVDLYLKNIARVNNWDLVDSSADKILGAWLDHIGDTSLLDRLAATDHLWSQRIAIIATFHFIRKGDFEPTFRIAEKLLHHTHDLIHKAVGWMLREVGKRDQKAEEAFLKKQYKTMPRTALRYAIEKFDEPIREKYLKGTA